MEEERTPNDFDDEYPLTPLPDDSLMTKIGEDLTFMAGHGMVSEIYQREKEIEQVIKILGMRKKGNPVILGEAGVGKTALVNYLALKIVRKEVPIWLRGKKIIRTSFLNLWSLVRSSDYPWPEYGRILKLVIGFCSTNPIILFMDEFHTIFSHSYSMDFLKPSLSSGKLRLIGATTSRDYEKFISQDEATARRFEPVVLQEPSLELTKKILKEIKHDYEEYYQAQISDEIIDFLVGCSNEYIHNRFQPDKSLTLLERTFINCSVKGKIDVKREDVEETLSEMTGIPNHILKKESDQISGLEAALNYHVLGQEEVIKKIAKRLLITMTNSSVNPSRPKGVFLLVGPSGVGKTELAKAIALHITGNDTNLIRLDMSLYNTAGSTYALLGASNDPNRPQIPFLTYQIKNKPNAVLLLDEVEKADREVLMLFLQVFDYGRLRDYQGNDLYFNNTIIIMTANIGFEKERAIIVFPEDDRSKWPNLKKKALEAVKKTFPLEFIGRIDEVLVFRPLSKDIMKGFIKQKINQLEKADGKKIILSKKAIELIIDNGFDPEYGARKLNYAIDELIGPLLAEAKMSPTWDEIKEIQIDWDKKQRNLKILKFNNVISDNSGNK